MHRTFVPSLTVIGAVALIAAASGCVSTSGIGDVLGPASVWVPPEYQRAVRQTVAAIDETSLRLPTASARAVSASASTAAATVQWASGADGAPRNPGFKVVERKSKTLANLGLSATYVQEAKKDGRSTHYITRYDVHQLDPEGIAARAGIRSDDVIVGFNHKTFLSDSLEASVDRLPAGQVFVLTVEPAGQRPPVKMEITKAAGVSPGAMVTLQRRTDEQQALVAQASADPASTGGLTAIAPSALAGFADRALLLRGHPYGVRLHLYLGSDGVAGMHYEGASARRYCGQWWTTDKQVCWSVLGASKPGVCYSPFLDAERRLVLIDFDPRAPERFSMIGSDSRDPDGLGRGARKAYDEYLRISAQEDRRVAEYAQAKEYCDGAREEARQAIRPDRLDLSPTAVYDRCMANSGFPMGVFNALSLRTVLPIYERMVTGSSSLGQCSF